MASNVRIYHTEDAARAADDALAKAGFANRTLLLASESQGNERSVVEAAIERGILSERTVVACTNALANGKSLVSVETPFGTAKEAISILEGVDGVDNDTAIGRYRRDEPAPLSEALELPVLSNAKPATMLTRSDWTFSHILGMGLLSSKAAPFSSMFGMPLLTKGSYRDRKSSFGFPLLSSSATPFSSLFGMTTLTKQKRPWDFSYGFPLLAKDATPFSSFFGMRTLTKNQ